MNDSVYDQLVEALDRKGGAFPAIKSSPSLRKLLETIFTDEEAILTAAIPFTPFPAEELAAKTGQPLDAVKERLDEMARKGIVYATQMGPAQIYMLLPMIPGIIEDQLMRGATDERSHKVARFTEDYIDELIGLEKAGDERLPKVPFARVLPVDQGIQVGSTVQPYDRLVKLLDEIEDFAVATCHCRHSAELTGHPCSKPKDVCLALSHSARYLSEYGMAKSISKEEALNLLKRAEEAGLVHITANIGDKIFFICNCCSCHCEVIKSMKRSPDYARAARSSLVADVQADDCVGCGNCLPRCPVEAITMPDDVAIVDRTACIGCGLCVSECPSEAIAMTNSDAVPAPYKDPVELYQAIQLSRKVL